MLQEEDNNAHSLRKLMKRLKSNLQSTLKNGKLSYDVNIDEKMKLIQEAKLSVLLKLIKQNEFEKLYENEYLYFLFHYFCIVIIIFRTKWKRNKSNRHYYDYVTPSDKAFVIVILENNMERYIERADKNIDKGSYCKKTKYTITSEKK